jgi:2-dehydro-3-deoxyphosphogalactonate aldolase
VIKATKMAGLLSYPGVMTPSECFAALRAGADGLKFFPGNLIGPAGM